MTEDVHSKAAAAAKAVLRRMRALHCGFCNQVKLAAVTLAPIFLCQLIQRLCPPELGVAHCN